MAEIVIDHCTLRIVRRSGWSWGPDRKRFLDDALRALPSLLARQLESLFPDEEDRTYEAPIRIQLALRVSDLKDATSIEGRGATPASGSDALPLDQRLEMALRAALEIPASPLEPQPQSVSRTERFKEIRPRTGAPASRTSAMQRLLFSHLESNDLPDFVAAFTDEEMEVWQAALRLAFMKPNAGDSSRSEEIIEAVSEAIRPRAVPTDVGRAGILRARLIAATEACAKLRIGLDNPGIWQALDHCIPIPEGTAGIVPLAAAPQSAEPARHDATSSSSPPMAMETPTSQTANASLAVAARSQSMDEWTTQIPCALPFLLLGPLTRIGYLDTLSAVLEAAQLADLAYLFAAGLAYKVLEPPARGWRRSDGARQSASVFAGTVEQIRDESIIEFARQAAPHTGLLDRSLLDTVASGRNALQPVLLRRAESDQSSGFLVVDTGGCFPLAWVDDAPAAAALIREMRGPAVIVSQEASGPSALRSLDNDGVCFVTQVPPTRAEAWKPILQGPSRLGWTNHASSSSEAVTRAARSLQISCEEAEDLWNRLGIERVAAPRATSQALERSLTLAASVAMGILAWQLWKDRGRTQPQLALERFGDLDARVRCTPEAMTIGLPRGRRQSELMEAGFLKTIRDVPWLDGRRLEFGWS